MDLLQLSSNVDKRMWRSGTCRDPDNAEVVLPAASAVFGGSGCWNFGGRCPIALAAARHESEAQSRRA